MKGLDLDWSSTFFMVMRKGGSRLIFRCGSKKIKWLLSDAFSLVRSEAIH